MNQSKIFIFSAPSGSGKSTIINYLMEQNLGLSFSISATSRAPRGEEQNGREYYFLSPDEFRKRIENQEFVEHEEVYANCFYGTLKSEIERLTLQGRHIVFDVDVVGGVNLKKIFGARAKSIFIMPPSVDELRRRLIARATDSEEKIAQRVAKAEHEMTYAKEFDTVVVNDDLASAKAEASNIVRSFIAE